MLKIIQSVQIGLAALWLAAELTCIAATNVAAGGDPVELTLTNLSQLGSYVDARLIAVRQVSPRGERRKEGRIVRVVERGSARIVGQVAAAASGRVHVVPFDRRMRERVTVPMTDNGSEWALNITSTSSRSSAGYASSPSSTVLAMALTNPGCSPHRSMMLH